MLPAHQLKYEKKKQFCFNGANGAKFDTRFIVPAQKEPGQ